MGARKIAFSRYAIRDLEEIVRHIARNDPSAAERTGLKLISHALTLTETGMVHMGSTLSDRPNFRKLVAGHYTIYYRVFPERVRILRFWHSAQNPARLRLDV